MHNVYYHGSRRLFAKPKLNPLGLFWLTEDKLAAKRYADEYDYLSGNQGHLYEVELSANAKIADLNDTNSQVTKALAKYIEDNRAAISTTFRKHGIPGIWWMSFEFLEENPDAIDFLKERVDGVILTDVADGHDHNSLTLFRLNAIKKFNLIQNWKAKVESKYKIVVGLN